jgi:predicted RNase H-like HicB family nuclease
MHYPAIVAQEGTERLIAFPDCPGCQTLASVNDNALKVAQEALKQWLKMGLNEGKRPPRPSGEVKLGENEQLMVVPVPDDLAHALEARWTSR